MPRHSISAGVQAVVDYAVYLHSAGADVDMADAATRTFNWAQSLLWRLFRCIFWTALYWAFWTYAIYKFFIFCFYVMGHGIPALDRILDVEWDGYRFNTCRWMPQNWISPSSDFCLMLSGRVLTWPFENPDKISHAVNSVWETAAPTYHQFNGVCYRDADARGFVDLIPGPFYLYIRPL
jgi:hypothetical protein